MSESGNSRDERLNEILARYLKDSEAGATLDQEEFAGRFPEFQDEIREFFSDCGRVGGALNSARDPVRDERENFPADEFELLNAIEEGGFGIVYKAREIRLDRVVAVKTPKRGRLESRKDVDRFHQEARAAARLSHPHIVVVHGTREHQGQPFLWMEYVAGGNLRDAVRGGPMDSHQAAVLLAHVADAVQHAHELGILHRDLKPANILLDEHGQPKITDFGLAKVIEQDTFSSIGDILGTPQYMSPEQAAGNSSLVDVRSDVYSLGATLYETITGAPPFRGKTVQETLVLVAIAEPERPRLINPKIPQDLEAICLRCLEKAPGKRYSTARELADDLKRFINHEPIAARAAGHIEQTWRTFQHIGLSRIGLVGGPLIGLLSLLMAKGWPPAKVIGIAAWMIIWWVTEAVPIWVTALLPLAAFPLLEITPAREVIQTSVDDPLVLFLGGMLIALGIEDSGLSRRLGLVVLRYAANARSVVLIPMVFTAFVSMWVSNTAAILIALPIVFGVILQLEKGAETEGIRNLRKGLLIGSAYAATIGGIATPVGTLANQILASSRQVQFKDWMLVGVPCAIVMTVAAWLLLVRRAFPVSGINPLTNRNRFALDLDRMGPVSLHEQRMLGIAATTALLWIFREPLPDWGWAPALGFGLDMVGDGTVAIAMAIACFAIPTGSKRGERLLDSRAISRVPWTVWFLFSGGLALAHGVKASGLDQYLGLKLTYLLGELPTHPLFQSFATVAIATGLTQLTSNYAAAKILLDLLGDNVPYLLLAATLGVSCDFMFPFSTPPSAIVFSAGKLRIRDMLKAGAWLTLISVITVSVFVALWAMS